MTPLRVVSLGLGPIGLAAAKLAFSKKTLSLVGAVDVDEKLQGRDLQNLLDLPSPTGVTVETNAVAAYQRLKPDVILHCTSSFMPVIKDQLLEAARAGVSVVSSSEELLVPDLYHGELATEIDKAAQSGGATILGTGVNPGYVMDFMAAISSAVCFDVQSVECVRVVDAGTRRLPLQNKVGAGITTTKFEELAVTGRFGHQGLRESVAIVGRSLGLELDAIEQLLEPVIATEERITPHLRVPAGHVAGIRHIGIGKRDGEVLVKLDLSMYVGAPDPRDEVHLKGTPEVHVSYAGGIPGDQATAAILVNNLHQVAAASPGLKTILDVPPPRLCI